LGILGLLLRWRIKKFEEKEEFERIYRSLIRRIRKRGEPEDFLGKYGGWEDQDGQENVKKMNPMRAKSSYHYEGKPEDPDSYYKRRWRK
jgi:hypothetical protein